jgi:hypothetical protein
MEVSAAAAGGSVAGVAGKKVSDGIDTIFGKLSKQTDAAAQTKQPAERAAAPRNSASAVPDAPPGPPGPATSGMASAAARVSRTVSAKPVHDPAPPPAGTSAPAPEPEAPPLTAAQLAEIQNGALRADVLAKIGAPYARILMPEDSHFVEVYQYAAKGQLLGSVRFTDGVVSTVRVN